MLDSTHFAAQNTIEQTTLDSFTSRVQVPWIHQFESSSWKMIPLLLTSFPIHNCSHKCPARVSIIVLVLYTNLYIYINTPKKIIYIYRKHL